MAAIVTKVGNAGKVLWRHKKKSAVAGIALYYLGDWLNRLHNDSLIRTAYAREALKFGSKTISAEDTPRRVTVLVNAGANERHANDKFTKNALPLLHLAGIQVDIIKAESSDQMRSLAAVIDPSEADAVFVVGGDGTLADVLTGIFAERKPELIRSPVPIGVFPGGNDNRSLQLLIPRLFQRNDDVRLQCESAMALIENSVQVVHPFKCTISSTLSPPVVQLEAGATEENSEAKEEEVKTKNKHEEHEDGTVVYALSDVSAGWFRHIEQRKHKLWYWLGWKRKFTYFWEMLKRSPEPVEIDLIYEEFCSGCRLCRPAVIQEKPQWRWWHMFTGTPRYANLSVKRDYSNVVNENCGREHTDKIVATDVIIANVQTDHTVSETSRLELIANDGEAVGRFEVISDGWKRSHDMSSSLSVNPDFYTKKLIANRMDLFVKSLPSFIPKVAVAGEWRTLEDYSNRKISIEATDKVIDLFVPTQLRFDHHPHN